MDKQPVRRRFGKRGVLIVNLGTPDSPTRGAVYRYLREFLTDRRVIDYPWLLRQFLVQCFVAPLRAGSSAKLYQRLWTEEGSPLKVYGETVAKGVQERLGKDYVVELAMRYQSPSIRTALGKLMEKRVSEIVIFPMFPQYASATTGSVHDEVMRLLRKEEIIPDVKMVNSYFDHGPMVDIFVDNALKFDLDSYDHILFSYHGLPERQLRKADPSKKYCTQAKDCCSRMSAVNQFCYSAQCHGTTRAIAGKLNLDPSRYTTTFQSRLGPEKWAQPYTIKVIEKLAEEGKKRLLVFSPAFVADCLETIVEIGYEYQEEFEEMGGEKVDLVPSLNDDPRWIEVVTDLVRAYAGERSPASVA